MISGREFVGHAEARGLLSRHYLCWAADLLLPAFRASLDATGWGSPWRRLVLGAVVKLLEEVVEGECGRDKEGAE